MATASRHMQRHTQTQAVRAYPPTHRDTDTATHTPRQKHPHTDPDTHTYRQRHTHTYTHTQITQTHTYSTQAVRAVRAYLGILQLSDMSYK